MRKRKKERKKEGKREREKERKREGDIRGVVAVLLTDDREKGNGAVCLPTTTINASTVEVAEDKSFPASKSI
jgi:hypothetical protein